MEYDVDSGWSKCAVNTCSEIENQRFRYCCSRQVVQCSITEDDEIVFVTYIWVLVLVDSTSVLPVCSSRIVETVLDSSGKSWMAEWMAEAFFRMWCHGMQIMKILPANGGWNKTGPSARFLGSGVALWFGTLSTFCFNGKREHLWCILHVSLGSTQMTKRSSGTKLSTLGVPSRGVRWPIDWRSNTSLMPMRRFIKRRSTVEQILPTMVHSRGHVSHRHLRSCQDLQLAHNWSIPPKSIILSFWSMSTRSKIKVLIIWL